MASGYHLFLQNKNILRAVLGSSAHNGRRQPFQHAIETPLPRQGERAYRNWRQAEVEHSHLPSPHIPKRRTLSALRYFRMLGAHALAHHQYDMPSLAGRETRRSNVLTPIFPRQSPQRQCRKALSSFFLSSLCTPSFLFA